MVGLAPAIPKPGHRQGVVLAEPTQIHVLAYRLAGNFQRNKNAGQGLSTDAVFSSSKPW